VSSRLNLVSLGFSAPSEGRLAPEFLLLKFHGRLRLTTGLVNLASLRSLGFFSRCNMPVLLILCHKASNSFNQLAKLGPCPLADFRRLDDLCFLLYLSFECEQAFRI